MARFTKSAVLYRQMRGRGTRKAPHIRKSDFTMFDFVGVTDFHGDDDGVIAGDVVREPSGPVKPGPTPPVLTLDVDDHIDPTSRDWATLDENGRIVRTAEHEARSALLGLRFEAWLDEQRFDAEQARWAGLIGSRIRADAMTVESFWDYDLDSHPFTGLGGYDQAVRVFGGRDALELVLGSLNVAVFDDNGPDTPTRADDRPTT